MTTEDDLPVVIVDGQRLSLLPERTAYWHETATLLVADAHFGKAAAYRASSVAVPGGTTADALRRLETALRRTSAERILFLGDLLHAYDGRTESVITAVSAWRARFPSLEWVLVRGNHDRAAGDPPASWRATCVDGPLNEGPFRWLHEPDEGVEDRYSIAGHVHPGVVLAGNGFHQRLACFLFGPRLGLLPAFGDFTGTANCRPRPGDRVFVIAGDEVIDKSPLERPG
jgi:DNA ligase-associated metallophosphoesterase